MTLSDLSLSADPFKDACSNCGGSGETIAFTEVNATLHHALTRQRAAVVKCGACDGTGKIADE
jgi:hypothetical protein